MTGNEWVSKQTIITNYSFEGNFRFMASACLKNALDKFWRKTAPNSVKEDERQALKANFLRYLTEPELKIARQMSVIIGKLARFELPHQWPDLITKLVQILQETASLQQLGSTSDVGASECKLATPNECSGLIGGNHCRHTHPELAVKQRQWP